MAGETIRVKPLDTLADLVSPGADSDELSIIVQNAAGGTQTPETKRLSDLVYPGASPATLASEMTAVLAGTPNNTGRRLADLISPGLSSTALATILSAIAGLPEPLVLDLFTSTASYSGGSNMTTSLVASAIPGVANAMKMTTTAVGSGQGIAGAKTLATQYNPDTDFGDVIAFMYSNDRYASNQVQFEIGRSNVFSGTTVAENSDDLTPGARWRAFPKSAFTSMPSGLGNIQLRPRYSTRVPSNAEVTYHAIVANAKGQPTMCLTLDDAHRSHYSVLYPWWQANMPTGSHFTVMVPNGKVGTANCYSLAEIQEMYAAGHDMACDSPNDFQFPFWTDPAGAAAALAEVQAYLTSNGMPRGAEFGCYPEGVFQATALDANDDPWEKSVRSSTIVANGTSSFDVGTLITANPAGTVVEIGMKMFGGFGANKVNGATVTNVVGTTITVDQNINSAVTRAAFIYLGDPFTRPAMQDAFRTTNGMKLMRTTLGGGTSGSAGYLPNFTRFGFGDQALTLSGQGYTGGVLSNMLLDLDKVAAVGGTITPYFHNIVTGTPAGLDTSMQDVMIPYLEGAVSRGFKFLSLSELWDRDNLGYQQLLT